MTIYFIFLCCFIKNCLSSGVMNLLCRSACNFNSSLRFDCRLFAQLSFSFRRSEGLIYSLRPLTSCNIPLAVTFLLKSLSAFSKGILRQFTFKMSNLFFANKQLASEQIPRCVLIFLSVLLYSQFYSGVSETLVLKVAICLSFQIISKWYIPIILAIVNILEEGSSCPVVVIATGLSTLLYSKKSCFYE